MPRAACRAPSPTIRAAHDLELWSYPSAEAQCGAIADDIAYDAHDIDDGLRAEMFRIEELASLPLLGDILREIAAQHPRLEPGRRAHELMRRLITRMIEDVIAQSRRHIAELEPRSADEVRGAGRPVVGFSAGDGARPTAPSRISSIRGSTATPASCGSWARPRRWCAGCSRHYAATPGDLPAEWLAGLDAADDARPRACGSPISSPA